jgi:L-cysteine desulfidase
MINVYEDGRIIARVNYNSNLDYWDGHNWTCGGVGYHKGITKLKSGKYVLIYGTQWEGERDYAEVISKEEALQEILRSGNESLLDKFDDLKKLYESMDKECS